MSISTILGVVFGGGLGAGDPIAENRDINQRIVIKIER